MKTSISGNKLVLMNGDAVEFDCPIRIAEEFSNTVVVILDVPIKREYYKNVFGVDYSGTIRWIIWNDATKNPKIQFPFIGIISRYDDVVVLANASDFAYAINVNTGKHVDSWTTR